MSMSEKDMEELRNILSLGCDYADTKTVVHETADETLAVMGFDLGIDCMIITDGEFEGSVPLEEFVDKFYSKMIEKVLNVISTQDN